MHESWPAWGGSTSGGTPPLLLPVAEKSRIRATGDSKTISCGELQLGGRRPATSAHQLTQSSASSAGVARRRTAPAHHAQRPSTAAVQAVSESVRAISSKVGAYPVAIANSFLTTF